MIYLDHNATTPLDPRVLRAMLPYLTERFGNASSYYQLGRDAREAVEAARERVAACIGGRAEEIVFTAGTHRDAIRMRYSDFSALVNPQVSSIAEMVSAAAA